MVATKGTLLLRLVLLGGLARGSVQAWLSPVWPRSQRPLGRLLAACGSLHQLGTMASALIVQADVHYGAKEVEPIHNANHLATVGDDGARDPLAHHLVGGNDLTGFQLYLGYLRSHDLSHRPLGRCSEVIYPLVPGLGDEGDVVHNLQVVAQCGGQEVPVSDEAYQEPFLIYHRNSRGPAL